MTVQPFRITVGLFPHAFSALRSERPSVSLRVLLELTARWHRASAPSARTALSDPLLIRPVPGRHSAMTVWSLTKTVLHPRTQRSFTHSMVRLDQTAPWRSETGLGKLLTPNEAYSSSGRTQWTGGSSLQKTRLGDSNSNASEKQPNNFWLLEWE